MTEREHTALHFAMQNTCPLPSLIREGRKGGKEKGREGGREGEREGGREGGRGGEGDETAGYPTIVLFLPRSLTSSSLAMMTAAFLED